MKASRKEAIAIALVAIFFASRSAHSQVTTDIRTDGTLGAKAAFSGPDVEIGAALGRRAGNNLFHSFERFNIGTGDRATFTNSGPGGLKNVISRVTGGKLSAIDGTLSSAITGADFWFINPAGVAFGPNAILDVPASLHVSTADELRFPGGEVFSATDPAKSVLSVAAPEAFGFLGATPAPISVDVGAAKMFGLSHEGAILSFVGGDIAVTGVAGSSIGTPGGEINFVSRASPGEVRLADVMATESALGTVRISGSPPVDHSIPFFISSSGDGGGAIRIRGGQVDANDVVFAALNLGGIDATGGIFIKANDVKLAGANYIFTSSVSNNSPGKMEIEAKNLSISGTGGIGTFSIGDLSASGDVTITAGIIEIDGTMGNIGIITNAVNNAGGGSITIIADELHLRGAGALISSRAYSGLGQAGSIIINAKNVIVEDGAHIGADTNSIGKGGDISINRSSNVHLTSGGEITSTATSSGSAGSITIDAENLVVEDGARIGADTNSSGKGGDIIIIRGSNLHLINGGEITSTTTNTGNAGTITIDAENIVVENNARISADTTASGQGGDVTITGGALRLTGRGEITSAASGKGAAGKISVGPFDEIEMANKGTISAESFGDGNAGSIDVEAPRISVNNSFIGANAWGAGNAGPVKVTANDQLTFTNEGRIFNGTNGSGNGGDITVIAGTLVADKQPIDHQSINHTGISASPQAGSSGNGGNIFINAGTIILRNGAQITTDTKGTGNAGSIDITMRSTLRLENDGLIGTCSGAGPDCKDRTNRFGATGDAGTISVHGGDKIILDHGRITSFARSETAEGGGIFLQANDIIYLKDSEVSSEVFGNRGTTAGNIAIATPMLVMNDSQMLARATEGTGGKIQIVANSLVVSQDSAIDASSQLGIDGTVALSTPEADVTSGLVVLPAAFVDVGSRLKNSCAVRGAAKASSFTRAGRVLPPGPEHPQMASYAPAAAGEELAAEGTELLWPGGELTIACGILP